VTRVWPALALRRQEASWLTFQTPSLMTAVDAHRRGVGRSPVAPTPPPARFARRIVACQGPLPKEAPVASDLEVKQALLDVIYTQLQQDPQPGGLLRLAEAYAWVVNPDMAHARAPSSDD